MKKKKVHGKIRTAWKTRLINLKIKRLLRLMKVKQHIHKANIDVFLLSFHVLYAVGVLLVSNKHRSPNSIVRNPPSGIRSHPALSKMKSSVLLGTRLHKSLGPGRQGSDIFLYRTFSIFMSSVFNLSHVAHTAPKILKFLYGFWQICALLAKRIDKIVGKFRDSKKISPKSRREVATLFVFWIDMIQFPRSPSTIIAGFLFISSGLPEEKGNKVKSPTLI